MGRDFSGESKQYNTKQIQMKLQMNMFERAVCWKHIFSLSCPKTIILSEHIPQFSTLWHLGGHEFEIGVTCVTATVALMPLPGRQGGNGRHHHSKSQFY